MSEERRKMAWELMLAVARSGVNPDSEWSAKKAWEVVDSFLENEGQIGLLESLDIERFTKERDKALRSVKDWQGHYNAACRQRDISKSEVKELKAENEKLAKGSDGNHG